MTELYYKMMREADGDICWRYLDKDEGLGRSFRTLSDRWVCLCERGHDDGVHEEHDNG